MKPTFASKRAAKRAQNSAPRSAAPSPGPYTGGRGAKSGMPLFLQRASHTTAGGDQATASANGFVQKAHEENHRGEAYEASPSQAARIGKERGQGAPLDQHVRGGMESDLGGDFRAVRVHADTESDALNRSMRSAAFTTGSDIFFRQGYYQPGDRAGRGLLAHELAHVVHQSDGSSLGENSPAPQPGGAGPPTLPVQRSLEDAFDEYRGECDCGEDLGNNCAHYLSDALILAGYSDLDGGEGALYRERNGRIVCKSGRPVRAKEMRDWFASQASSTNSGEPDDSQHWAVYQHDGYPGGHVVIHSHDGSEYDFKGTGDYPEWETQMHYTW